MKINNQSNVHHFRKVVTLTLLIFLGLPFILPRSFELKLNGKEMNYTTNAYTKSIAANKLSNEYQIEDYVLLTESDSLHIKSKKEITLVVDGKETIYETYENTMEDFIKSNEQIDDSFLTDYIIRTCLDVCQLNNDQVYYANRIKVENLIEKKVDPSKVTYTKTADLYDGVERITQQGHDGLVEETFEVTYLDNKEVGKKLIKTNHIQDSLETKIIVGTKAWSNGDTEYDAGVWDELAFCESGGNWGANSGNGYHGGVQFTTSTWNTASNAVGVDAPYAYMATKEEQIKAASWLQKQSGWGQWPHCSSKIGLR